MNRSPQTGWWSRHWKWVVPTGCLGVLVLFALLVGGGIFAVYKGANRLLIDSEPWRYANARAAADPRIQSALGTPLQASGIPSGSASTENGDSKADFSVGVRGPKGDGKLYVVGRSEAGYWRYGRFEIVVSGSGQRIDLREPARIDPPASDPTP